MSKAFNCLNWDFLRQMFTAFGFCQEWISWIYNLVSTTFLSILVNESTSSTFNPSLGIKQGNPLSPFLYILMAKGLGRIFKTSLFSIKIKGIKIHQNYDPLFHLQFIDNTYLMGPRIVQEASALKLILDTFMKASRTMIN